MLSAGEVWDVWHRFGSYKMEHLFAESPRNAKLMQDTWLDKNELNSLRFERSAPAHTTP